MPSKSVTLVELAVYERLLPLASGYLQAYACQDPVVDETYDFNLYTNTLFQPPKTLLDDLIAQDSDVYGFSCYIWNTGLIRRLLPPLMAARPDAQFLLGGPQVVKQPKYLDPENENLLLCNGEGEKTFANLLKELTTTSPDLSRIRGLSFYRDRELITTEHEEKIMSLDEIPSPFLTGVFARNRYTQAIFETNRGCPFKCSFCFWGLGEHRVSKFDEARIYEELDWIADNDFWSIFIADANFGMLARDVDFAHHLVKSKERTGLPYMIGINTAKNRPDRLIEIASILQLGGINATQSMAIQSLDSDTLETIDRGNIKVEAYAEAQRVMNERNMSSYVELIWPLPGETLETFGAGFNTMCEMNAPSFIAYPLLLLQNTTMAARREEHGFVTTNDCLEDTGEYELVIATNEVSGEDFEEGLRLIHAVNTLHNSRALYSVSRHLNASGQTTYSQIFWDFLDFCRGKELAYLERWEEAIGNYDYCHWAYWGEIFHLHAHQMRDEIDALIHEFVASRPWWNAETRFLFEMDLVARPYGYSNTPVTAKNYEFEFLRVVPADRGYNVTVPEASLPMLDKYAELCELGDVGPELRIDHRQIQMPYMPSERAEKNYSYCYGVVTNIRNFVPKIRQPVAVLAN